MTSIEPVLQGWGNESWIADTAIGRLIVKVGLSPMPTSPSGGRPPLGWRSPRAADVSAPDLLAFVDAADVLEDRILRIFRCIPGRRPG